MVHDLEEVLAIEAARTGQTTGEATTVLKSLSGDTADFAPDPPAPAERALALTLLVLAALAATGVFLATRTEKGPGVPVVKKPRGLTEVRLAGNAASDYDPEGDNRSRPRRPASRSTASAARTGTRRATRAASRAATSRASACMWTPAS